MSSELGMGSSLDLTPLTISKTGTDEFSGSDDVTLTESLDLSHVAVEKPSGTLLTIDADAPDSFEEDGIEVTRLALSVKDDRTLALKERYLGDNASGVYLIRPDQHVAARRPSYDDNQFRAAIRRAVGKE